MSHSDVLDGKKFCLQENRKIFNESLGPSEPSEPLEPLPQNPNNQQLTTNNNRSFSSLLLKEVN